MVFVRSLSVALALFLLGSAAEASSSHLPIHSRRRSIVPATLDPLLRRGELALVETDERGQSRQIVLFTVVAASPEKVYDVIVDVEAYPEFLRSIESTKIIQKKGPITSYEWELDVPVFDLRGTRAMRGRRPHFVEVRGLTGHFRNSQDRWELFPLDGGKRTLVALYRAVEFSHAGVILQTLVKLEPSMANALNLALGFVQLRSLRRHVEGLPELSYGRPTGPVPPLVPLRLGEDGLPPLSALEPLLRFGELALIESNEDGSLRQAALWAAVSAKRERVHAVVADAAEYAQFIPTFAETKLSQIGPKSYRLEYELDIPLVSIGGVTRIDLRDDGSIDMEATAGDVDRARWRWEVLARGEDRTILVHYTYSDIAESSWFVKKLIKKEPLLEHGIVVASSSIGVHAIKERSEGKR